MKLLERFVKIREYLGSLDSDDVDRICLTPTENRQVDTLPTKLRPLESITKHLQNESTTLSETRALFDAMIESYPDTAHRLSSNADIVHCTEFEAAIVKIQRGSSCVLSREESIAVSSLAVSSTTVECADDEGLSFAERALKRHKSIAKETVQKHADTPFLIPTSNVCERLFSKAR